MNKGMASWALAAALAVLLGIGAGVLSLRSQGVTLRSGTLLKTPRPISEFSLRSAQDQPFGKADLTGHWTVVFAGFTFCPDVCPTTLTELKAAYARLGDAAGKVRVLFLSVDPERDAPAKIAQYLAFFEPRFDGATGDTATLDALARELGFVYAKVPGATPETYTIDHSTALILIDPQARVAGYLTPPFRPDLIAHDLQAIVAAAP